MYTWFLIIDLLSPTLKARMSDVVLAAESLETPGLEGLYACFTANQILRYSSIEWICQQLTMGSLNEISTYKDLLPLNLKCWDKYCVTCTKPIL